MQQTVILEDDEEEVPQQPSPKNGNISAVEDVLSTAVAADHRYRIHKHQERSHKRLKQTSMFCLGSAAPAAANADGDESSQRMRSLSLQAASRDAQLFFATSTEQQAHHLKPNASDEQALKPSASSHSTSSSTMDVEEHEPVAPIIAAATADATRRTTTDRRRMIRRLKQTSMYCLGDDAAAFFGTQPESQKKNKKHDRKTIRMRSVSLQAASRDAELFFAQCRHHHEEKPARTSSSPTSSSLLSRELSARSVGDAAALKSILVNTTTTSAVATKKKKLAVRFGTLQIHHHLVTLDYNPGQPTTKGAPLAIDWELLDTHHTTVDQYEATREPRRSHRGALKLTPEHRQEVLLRSGFDLEDIELATNLAQTFRTLRQISTMDFDDVATSAANNGTNNKERRKRTIHENNKIVAAAEATIDDDDNNSNATKHTTTKQQQRGGLFRKMFRSKKRAPLKH